MHTSPPAPPTRKRQFPSFTMAHSVVHQLLLLFCIVGSLISASSAQTCKSHIFSNRNFASCSDLPVLNAYLHWTYFPSNGTVDIAYRATPASSAGWVAWAINPTGSGMVGSQAIVGYVVSDQLTIITTAVDSLNPAMQNGTLSFPVSKLAGETFNNEITLYATLSLPSNSSTVNQVWQTGPVSGGSPVAHIPSGDNVRSTGVLNLLSGQSASTGRGKLKIQRKNVHGILNAVSWGILMPLGAIIARHMRVFKSADPAWFYLHVSCQCSAYILGVAGWGTGLKLGSESQGIQYSVHRNIGITLFCLATLQVLALFLRPQKDHKYRLYWEFYHHCVGYAVIGLSVGNVFRGLNILTPDNKWRHTYIGIIIALGAIFLILEVSTWVIVLRRRSRTSAKSHHGANAANGTNGYCVRSVV